MSKFHSHLSSAKQILGAYSGAEPFVHFIKKHFAANKKYGSKDRRSVSNLCYNYFRAGNVLKERPMNERLLLSLFLCGETSNEMLDFFYPELNEKISLPVEEKVALINVELTNLFPFQNELSTDIGRAGFASSLLHQPKLFVRVRPGRKNIVETRLTAADIIFENIADNTLSIRNATSLEDIIAINKDVVIQDKNSQHVLDFLDEQKHFGERKITAWDCCAASGGKAILLYDKLHGKVQLTVSDIRKSILHNCEKRLQQAKVEIYKSFVADLTQKNIPGFTDSFPLIVCDAPCTGSGTWGRTPEQLFYFDKNQIGEYVQKQQKIALNACRHLQTNGLFFYITCSVFEKENEGVIKFLQQQTGCRVLHQQYYKGYESGADSMFVSVITI